MSLFFQSTVSGRSPKWREGLTLAPAARSRIGWRKKLQISFLLLAWVAATGAHWDVLQVVAWGKMMAENFAEMMSVGSAVEQTFAPGSSCPLCKMVSQAKQQERKQEGPGPTEAKAVVKMILYLQENATVPTPEISLQRYALVEAREISYGRAQPPIPPPKV